MRYGEEPVRGYDLSSLERVVCAGEVLNAPAWEWLQKAVLEDRVPVIDHWWQTETGCPVIGNPYGLGLEEIRPGSAGRALPGMEVAVLTSEGEEMPSGVKGIFVFREPFPSLTPRSGASPSATRATTGRRSPASGSRGDSAHMDEEGYVWFAGRADELIKIAAHRLGTIGVETAFLKIPPWLRQA
jgi:acetyl-CoA synthetase